jgi:hypothetical protein
MASSCAGSASITTISSSLPLTGAAEAIAGGVAVRDGPELPAFDADTAADDGEGGLDVVGVEVVVVEAEADAAGGCRGGRFQPRKCALSAAANCAKDCA